MKQHRTKEYDEDVKKLATLVEKIVSSKSITRDEQICMDILNGKIKNHGN
jgi:hypothetical protein